MKETEVEEARGKRFACGVRACMFTILLVCQLATPLQVIGLNPHNKTKNLVVDSKMLAINIIKTSNNNLFKFQFIVLITQFEIKVYTILTNLPTEYAYYNYVLHKNEVVIYVLYNVRFVTV